MVMLSFEFLIVIKLINISFIVRIYYCFEKLSPLLVSTWLLSSGFLYFVDLYFNIILSQIY